MNISFTGKTILITGGASGIGLAMVREFAGSGASVQVLEPNADQAAAAINDASVTVHACDVSNQTMVKTAVDRICADGRVDVLINNAGVAHIGTAETTGEADIDRLYAVNIKGVYNCIHAVIPHMKKTGGGVILNMASIAGSLGIPERFAYSMTKGAVLSMTLSVARDFLKDNIRCNSISPARVHTPFIDGYLARNYPGREPEMFEKLAKTQPIGRMAKPTEVADLALYLCSDAAAFITGTDYPIDGGFIKLSAG